MRTLFNQPNVDKSDLVKYPPGRIRDNDGSGNGTGVNEATKGDMHQFFEKLMRLYDITPNDLPDNEANGFQLIDALRGVASKNDFIYPLSTNGTILSVDIKFSQMLDNEYIVCLAAFDKGSETQIKGSGPATFAITYSGNFKTNEYVRVVKTSGGVSIIRVADALSIDAMVSDALFLKKASQAQENAGSVDTVATTPLTNLVAFTRRVIGVDSGGFLATALANGLYPKEHFAIVAAIGANPIKNVGWFSGWDIGGAAVSLPVNGDIATAVSSNSGSASKVVVTVNNAMPNTNYYVRTYIEGTSASIYTDIDITGILFRKISVTQFEIGIRELSGDGQNLKIHLEVVQL